MVNILLIKVIFSGNEAEVIKRIPLSTFNCPNQIIWRCLKNGNFYVRSAYHLCSDMLGIAKGQGSSSNPKKKILVNTMEA